MKNLLIVDMQNGFIHDGNKHLVTAINSYIENNKFDNIFYTKFSNTPSSPFSTLLKWEGMKTPAEQEICVNIANNASIINKTTHGLDASVVERFKALGISEIEICGTDSDACVLSIALQLFDFGIRPLVIKSLCGTSSANQKLHEYAFAIIERVLGVDCVIE